MNSQLIFAIGLVAGACTTLSFLPQLYHIWKRRSADDISGIMYSVFAFGSLLWFIYGLGIRSWPIIIANFTTLCFNLGVLFLKWQFSRESRVGESSSPVRFSHS